MTPDAKDRKNLLAVNLSLGANLLLAAAKTVVGIVGHSPALLADGINSVSDVAYLIVVRIFMGMAGKPPDREHPYGHRQLESISALVVGAFVVATAIAIFWNAVDNVYNLLIGQTQYEGAAEIALWVAVATLLAKLGLTFYTTRVGQQTGSIAVLAVARDHRNDIFSIVAAGTGILLSRTGLIWLDPLAAALVALVILKTGIEILRDSSSELMNISPEQPLADRIRELVRSVEKVDQVEEIRAHRFGQYLLVNVTIGIDGSLTVAAGDEVATRVERALRENIEYLRHVSVHYHPSQQQRHPSQQPRHPGEPDRNDPNRR